MKYLIKVLIVGLLCSCDGSKFSWQEEALKKIDRRLEYSKLLLVPSFGCNGCIDGVKSFLRKNLDNLPNTSVVLTCVSSMKQLSIDFGEELIRNPYVFADTANIFCKRSLPDHIYPQIWFLDSGDKIREIDVLSPGKIERLNSLVDRPGDESEKTIDLFSHIEKTSQERLSSFASSIRYIPIKGKNGVYIDRIFKSVLFGDLIFLSNNKMLVALNLDGDLLCSITKIGKGPGEYIAIDDFSYDPDKKEILLLARKKVLFYDLKGSFLREFLLPFQASNIGRVSQGRYCYYLPDIILQYEDDNNSKACNIRFSDGQGNQIGQVCAGTLPEKPLYYYVPQRLFHTGEKLIYQNFFDEMLYEVQGDGLTPYMRINMGGKIVKPSHYYTQEAYLSNFANYISLGEVFDSPKATIINYFYKRKIGRLIELKPSRKVFHTLSSKDGLESPILNDLDGMPFWPKIMDDSYMVDIIDPITFKKYVAERDGKDGGALNKLSLELKDYDNPILQIVTLK